MTNQKKDDSPSSFEPQKPDKKKNGGKTVYVVLGVLIMLGGVLYLGVMHGGVFSRSEKTVYTDTNTAEKPLAYIDRDDQGIALLDDTEKIEHGVYIEDFMEPNNDFNITVVVPEKDISDEEAAYLRRLMQERQQYKMQMEQAALISNMLVGRKSTPPENNTDNSKNTNTNPAAGSQMSAIPSSEHGYDPASNKDKEAFFQRADTTFKDGWVSPYTREAGRKLELKTGTVVPGTLITGINSDLPGNIIAQVSQNVFDSTSGQHLLIPQGSKIYGVYDSRVTYGQARVLIAWNRIIFPDGSSVTLGAMPGTDLAGLAGFNDKVNNHYLRIFGTAVLMSLINGGMSYAVDSMNSDSDDGTSVQNEMSAAFANMLGQTTLSLLQKNLSIAPTIEIRSGYNFNIIITKDMIFRTAFNSNYLKAGSVAHGN